MPDGKAQVTVEYENGKAKRIKTIVVSVQHSKKDDYEEYVRKVIGRAYFIILNKIDELDGTNDRLLKYYRENIEKYRKV